eukprot:TRINITY_DN2967_c1_g2_i3.p1 TRINITY_DN2967_c1_g2~~TRINITY_DN2967_c1_g2_i3.p1  ORF type:complete len:479 (-),score=42.04 TRINITY_DN2967_c1_g2_i3:80-1516(-)
MNEMYDNFLSATHEVLVESRLSRKRKYEEYSSSENIEAQILGKVLMELQEMKEQYEDGVLILNQLIPPIINLDQISESIDCLLKGLYNHSTLQIHLEEEICKMFSRNKVSTKEEKFEADGNYNSDHILFSTKDDTLETSPLNLEGIENVMEASPPHTLIYQDGKELCSLDQICADEDSESKDEKYKPTESKKELIISETEEYIKVEMEESSSKLDFKNNWQCALCRKKLKTKNSLDHHVKKHHTHSKYPHFHTNFSSENCESLFPSDCVLKSHMQRQDFGVEPFKCDQCFKEFLSRGGLKAHMRTHTGEKPFKCKECQKTFSHKGHLTDHQHVHSGQKPFQCEVCGMTFARMRSKVSHMSNHLQDKPFKCEICHKGFGIKRVLTKHMQTHTGEKPFQCDICNKCFVSNFVLKVHMRKHTGEKPYKCDQCFKMFTQSSSLADHMRTHTGEKPFKCDQCIKQFSTKSILRKHMLSHGRKL